VTLLQTLLGVLQAELAQNRLLVQPLAWDLLLPLLLLLLLLFLLLLHLLLLLQAC
jgi:hypothetical protein